MKRPRKGLGDDGKRKESVRKEGGRDRWNKEIREESRGSVDP